MKDITRIKLMREIREWVGTPYFHMAKEKHNGADCGLFLAQAYKNAGMLTHVEDLYYSRTWMITGTQEMMLQGFTRHFENYLVDGFRYELIQVGKEFEFKQGDIICMTTPGSVVCHHAGLYDERGYFFHCYQNIGVHLAQFGYKWRNRTRYVYRIYED